MLRDEQGLPLWDKRKGPYSAVMEYALFALALLIFYVERDSELLRIAGPSGTRRRVVLYGASMGLAVVAVSLLATTLGPLTGLRRIRHPHLIQPLLIMQLAIWFYFTWLRRHGDVKRLWTVAVLPSPVLALCLVGIVFALHSRFPGVPLVVPALLVAIAWIAWVVLWLQWSTRMSDDDPGWGVSFAAFSNALTLLLLPLDDFAAWVRTAGGVVRGPAIDATNTHDILPANRWSSVPVPEEIRTLAERFHRL